MDAPAFLDPIPSRILPVGSPQETAYNSPIISIKRPHSLWSVMSIYPLLPLLRCRLRPALAITLSSNTVRGQRLAVLCGWNNLWTARLAASLKAHPGGRARLPARSRAAPQPLLLSFPVRMA